MSRPNYTLVTTDEADDDRADIISDTIVRWGIEQAQIYNDLMDSAFAAIQDDPRIGRTYPNLAPAYRFYHAEHHNIFYRVDGLEIIILRVLHEKMDAIRHIR